MGLARAMVIEPQILLMDEPLSNLDAKLRIELRDDIRDLQHSLGITTIYVTHDQEEALVISDRICVMQGGRVHQVGTPWEIYAQPATLFVASFVGAMNVVADLPVGAGGALSLGAAPRRIAGARRPRPRDAGDPARGHDAGATADTVPDDALASTAPSTRSASPAARRSIACDSTTGPQIQAHVHRPERRLLEQAGARCGWLLPLARLHMFDPATGRRIEAASMTRGGGLDFWSGVLAIGAAVVAVLMVWPLYSIFAASVIDNRSGALTLGNFAQILGHPAYRGALINSLIVGTGGMWARCCSAFRSPC